MCSGLQEQHAEEFIRTKFESKLEELKVRERMHTGAAGAKNGTDAQCCFMGVTCWFPYKQTGES
jgi:hypothetical protein